MASQIGKTRVRSACVAGAVALVSVLSASLAHAQPGGDEARAQTLFDAAKQLRDGGQLADACPMFAESERLAPGIGVTLHLADCYERMGRTASAWDAFGRAEKLALARSDEKRAAIARGRGLALEAKLERMTIASSAPREGWQVLLDGVVLPAAMWNAPLAVDPGDHLVVVNAPGQAPRTLRAHVDSVSAASVVRIDDVPAPRAAAAPALASTHEPLHTEPAPSPSPSGPSPARVWFEVGLTAAGLAGVGLGAAFMVKRNQLMTDGSICDTPQNEDDTTTAAAIAFAAGGAALVSALALFLSSPGPAPSTHVETGWVLAPAPLEGGGGAVLRGAF